MQPLNKVLPCDTVLLISPCAEQIVNSVKRTVPERLVLVHAVLVQSECFRKQEQLFKCKRADCGIALFVTGLVKDWLC